MFRLWLNPNSTVAHISRQKTDDNTNSASPLLGLIEKKASVCCYETRGVPLKKNEIYL